MANHLEQTTNSLKRIQDTNADELARTNEMGPTYNFSAVVQPARRLITLFQQIPLSILPDIPDQNLAQIQQQCDALYNIFKQIVAFNLDQGNLGQARTNFETQLTNTYVNAWQALQPYISYSAARAVDFQRLEREGRAAVQGIEDRTTALLTEMDKIKAQAVEALKAAQQAAAEQGVAQQAIYFQNEANEHETEAKRWRTGTVWLAIALGVYSALTLVLYRWTKPTTSAEAAEFITSKFLVFAVISYMLLLSAKNFLSHKHNAIVNRHRQNALMTFNALATAASDPGAKDIVLTHAAACIFAPQETGYAKSAAAAPEGSLAQAAIGLLAKGESRVG